MSDHPVPPPSHTASLAGLGDRDADTSQPSPNIVDRLRLCQDVRGGLWFQKSSRYCTHNGFNSMSRCFPSPSRHSPLISLPQGESCRWASPSPARPTQPSNPMPRQLLVRVRCTRPDPSKSHSGLSRTPRLHDDPPTISIPLLVDLRDVLQPGQSLST